MKNECCTDFNFVGEEKEQYCHIKRKFFKYLFAITEFVITEFDCILKLTHIWFSQVIIVWLVTLETFKQTKKIGLVFFVATFLETKNEHKLIFTKKTGGWS